MNSGTRLKHAVFHFNWSDYKILFIEFVFLHFEVLRENLCYPL